MLPFLAPRKSSGVIIAKRVGDKTEPMHEEGEMDPGLMAAADDLVSAVHMKDAKAVAMALKAAFDVCDSGPEEDEQGEQFEAE